MVQVSSVKSSKYFYLRQFAHKQATLW